jgi:hypothetical protein
VTMSCPVSKGGVPIYGFSIVVYEWSEIRDFVDSAPGVPDFQGGVVHAKEIIKELVTCA